MKGRQETVCGVVTIHAQTCDLYPWLRRHCATDAYVTRAYMHIRARACLSIHVSVPAHA